MPKNPKETVLSSSENPPSASTGISPPMFSCTISPNCSPSDKSASMMDTVLSSSSTLSTIKLSVSFFFLQCGQLRNTFGSYQCPFLHLTAMVSPFSAVYLPKKNSNCRVIIHVSSFSVLPDNLLHGRQPFLWRTGFFQTHPHLFFLNQFPKSIGT